MAAKEVQALELEEELADLEVKKCRLLERRKRRRRTGSDSVHNGATAMMEDQANTGRFDDWEDHEFHFTVPLLDRASNGEDGYYSYGHTSRWSRSMFDTDEHRIVCPAGVQTVIAAVSGV